VEAQEVAEFDFRAVAVAVAAVLLCLKLLHYYHCLHLLSQWGLAEQLMETQQEPTAEAVRLTE
jgi:hypothetical protein